MTKSCIIHIIIGPFPEYNAIASRIKQTQELDMQVQIWDLAEMAGLPPTKHQNYNNLITCIKNRKQLYRLISSNKYALFVTGINPEIRFIWFYYYLAKFHCKHAKIANGWAREYGASKRGFMVKIREKIKKFFLSIADKAGVISLPKHIFLPGSYWDNKLAGKPKIISVNHLLYDQYIELLSCSTSTRAEYILFLDEAHTHHPDWEICNIKPMDQNTYYHTMQTLFDKIEDKFQMPIIIAAHPKAKYQGHEFGKGKFGERRIVFNKTNELAQGAKIFLAHFSTTRVLAIIYHKPLYLIWLYDFRSYPQIFLNNIVSFSRETGAPILDEKIQETDFDAFTPNIYQYNTFLDKYYIGKNTRNINSLDHIGLKLLELAQQ